MVYLSHIEAFGNDSLKIQILLFPKLSSPFPAKMELPISIATTNRMRPLFFIFFPKLRLQFECDFYLSATYYRRKKIKLGNYLDSITLAVFLISV